MSLQASAETPEFMEKVSCLRMMFWLTVYQCLYNQEVRDSQVQYYLSTSIVMYLIFYLC